MTGRARADAIVSVKKCEQMSRMGHRVTMVAPTYVGDVRLDHSELWRHYGLRENSFEYVSLPTFLRRSMPGPIAGALKFACHFMFAVIIAMRMAKPENRPCLVISRDALATFAYFIVLAPLRRWVTFLFELHDPGSERRHDFLYRSVDGVYCTTDAVRRALEGAYHLDPRRTRTIRNGFDPAMYSSLPSKQRLREQLGLPANRPIVTYTGKVPLELKEIEMIVEAALTTPDACFVFVGGRQAAVDKWTAYCAARGVENVRFVGFVDPADVPAYQACSDILVMYYPADWPIRASISPAKMIEYMATGNAVVSVEFETIAEVLHHDVNALLIEPNRPEALAGAMRRLLDDPALSRRLGENAHRDAGRFTWACLGEAVLEFYHDVAERPYPAVPITRNEPSPITK